MLITSSRGWLITLLGLLAVVTGHSSPNALGQTPAAQACALEPVSLPLFDATPAVDIANAPVATTTVFTIDEDEIRFAVETFVECMNSGDAAYQYAIFTDRYLANLFVEPALAYQPQFEEQLARGPTGQAGGLRLIGVKAIKLLDNGTVSLVVEIGAGFTSFQDTLILATIDGVWLIDDVVNLDPPE
jgi:hypothetical protein